MGIVELEKPAGRWCPHCAPGRGCKIYDQRPESCRIFSCTWLTTPMVPEALKPDRTKVVLGLDMGGSRLVAHIDPDAPLAWRKEPMFSFLKTQAARAGGAWHVVARLGDRMWLVTPSEVFDMGLVPPGAPYTIEDRGGALHITVQGGEPAPAPRRMERA